MMAGVAIGLAGWCLAEPSITDVTAQQRYPWNGKVDISYTVSGDIAAKAKEEGLITSLKVSAIDQTTSTTNIAMTLSGDLSLADGTHKIVWDMNAQGLIFKSTNVVFNVSCEEKQALYCIIDLSGGTTATSYPVSYLTDVPSGGWTDEYKTTKLVLKRVQPGTFILGGNQSDLTHQVKLTKAFYMGIFELTQKQYSLVMGANPSYWNGDKMPVGNVRYSSVRGGNWPSSTGVDSSSFMGVLQAKTKLNFDLPTEAQWEYVCRAGTTTAYYWGNSMNGNYAWYSGNSSLKTQIVGLKTPNQWGFFDMAGNVSELCLDYYNLDTQVYGTDPQGISSGRWRVIRGGGVKDNDCNSSWRYNNSYTYYADETPDYTVYYTQGFRLSRTIK